MPPPLQGVRILAISQFGAGPYATMLLADLGAEVIKIEDPSTGGDVSRFVPPYIIEKDSLYFQSFNRNKKSLTLNLKTSEGREIFQQLARISHAVFNNLRGDQVAKLGLDYDSLKEVNPRIVCCSLSGFGTVGARTREPGYDYLMQAYSGYMSLTGAPETPPAACGVSVIDHAAGFAAALGLVTALYSAERVGVGRNVEVALIDTAASMLTYLAAWHLNKGFKPVRRPGSAHQTLVPVQSFRSRDGHLVIFCAKEKFWQELCGVLGVPELAVDERFNTFAQRHKNREAVISLLQQIFCTKTTAEWVGLLRGKVPCAPVNDLEGALADPFLAEREMIIETDHPAFGKIRQVASPVRISGVHREHRPAPALGHDTDQILKEYVGYTENQISVLREKGVV